MRTEYKQYKDFQPTGFDPKGLALDDQQEWRVLGVGHNRDSEILTESNWDTALAMLGGESDDVQVHRFGHWGPGWFEIIIINPLNTEKMKIADEIEDSLSDYPVLCDEDLSRREWESASEYWDNMNLKDRIDYLHRADMSIFQARRWYADVADKTGRLHELLLRV